MFPIIYESDYVSIQTFWVFIVAALLISSYIAVKRLKRRRVNFNLLIKHSTSLLISGLILSRVIYFVTHTTAYFPALDLRTLINLVAIWDQGLSFWGAFIGVTGMLAYRLFREKEAVWKWFDALSIPTLIGVIIGNIGALLGGYAYGTPTTLPWGITYNSFNVKYTTAIHPTQIYMVLAMAGILWSKQKLKNRTDFFKTDGNTSIYIATLFSFAYFLVEFVRGDDTLLLLGTVRISQIIAFLAFIASGYLLRKRYKEFKNPKPKES